MTIFFFGCFRVIGIAVTPPPPLRIVARGYAHHPVWSHAIHAYRWVAAWADVLVYTHPATVLLVAAT